MRLIRLCLVFVALVLCCPPGATAAGNSLRDGSLDAKTPSHSVTIAAVLISASNEKGKTDSRLSAVESTLKRTLRFEQFGFVGEGSTRITMPGHGSIALPRGQSVKVEAAYYGENSVWMRVIWLDGGRERINLVFAKQERGVPVVVGGGVSEGENLAIMVTPR